jgi:putative ABC transport system permease protein
MPSLSELIASVEIGLIYGVLAIGIYLTFRTINFPDLTCDGSFVFGAAVSSAMIKSGGDPCLSLVLSLVAGGLAGFFTGILNTLFKIEDLLSGIIVAFMLYSINLRIMGPNIAFADEPTAFSCGNWPLIVVAVLVASFSYVLNTDWGLGLRTVGQNKKFAASCGVNVNAATIIGLVVSNALIGMCGALFAQYQGFCDISQGVGCLVIGLASVIVGEKIVKPKTVAQAIVACVVGSIAYRIFIALALRCDALGLKTQDLNLITGLLVIAVMTSRKNAEIR